CNHPSYLVISTLSLHDALPIYAVLVVAGDIDVAKTKKMIQDYFGPIPRGAEVTRDFPKEAPITEPISATAYDPNIQIPAVIAARSEEHTSELQSRENLVCRLLL